MEIHRIHPELLERQVRVLVVGCGGTGSAVVAGLPYLHQSLMARGHPGGLHVTVMDGDAISPTNCIRQPFCAVRGRSQQGDRSGQPPEYVLGVEMGSGSCPYESRYFRLAQLLG